MDIQLTPTVTQTQSFRFRKGSGPGVLLLHACGPQPFFKTLSERFAEWARASPRTCSMALRRHPG
jgi:hypothetical protein